MQHDYAPHEGRRGVATALNPLAREPLSGGARAAKRFRPEAVAPERPHALTFRHGSGGSMV